MKKNFGLLVVSLCLMTGAAIVCQGQPPANEQDTVLPGRHLSEHQVADIASKELPGSSAFSCAFADGVWVISEPQKGVWGVSSTTTNADGHIFIQSTNATQVVLKVHDADGTVEPVKKP